MPNPLSDSVPFGKYGALADESSSQELARRLRYNITRWQAATAEWVDATLDLATTLWEAHQKFPSNAAFGMWLIENELDKWGSNDRAALINMAEHREVTRLASTE
jgi:hypothetical protein